MFDAFQTVTDAIKNELLKQNRALATAESCTGGLLAGICTHWAGSSIWFERGFVTYSNQSKVESLGVPATLIAEHGAVSIEVAEAMARGCIEHSKADYAIAITGVAGPGGGSEKKPVGTVFIGLASRLGKIKTIACHFTLDDRERIRMVSCEQALVGLLGFIRQS